MSINLRKGQKIDLTKKDSGQQFRHLMVGLGWDEVERSSGLFSFFSSSQENADCDASVILCGADGKLIGKSISESMVFFNNLRHSSGAIIHQGDNLTGAGEGDDEQIMVDLAMIPGNIAKLVFVVNIYDANKRKQHFGMIKNAFIRLVDTDGRKEICRFDLTEDYSGMTGLVVGEIYRYKGNWKFNAIGQPVKEASRLDSLLDLYR